MPELIIGRRLNELPFAAEADGVEVYAEKNGESVRVKAGDPGGLATLDETGGIPADQQKFTPSGDDGVTRDMQVKVREYRKSITDYGGQAGLPDNRLALTRAIAACARGEELLIPYGRFSISSMPDNTKGVRFVGPGQLVLPGALSQVNTYRYERPIFINAEALWRVFQVPELTNRALRVYTYGDSTVAGGLNYISWGFFLQELLPRMASAAGFQNAFTVTNRGVGGSSLGDWTTLADVGVNSANPGDLFIIKYGINDAFPEGTRVDVFEQRLRAKLAAIRAVSGGDYGSLSILLVGPNPVWDAEFDARNSRWFEQLRPIFEAAAHDYQCAFFDAYALLQDARGAPGRWLDSAENGSGTGLHPTNIGQAWIWGRVMDELIGGMKLLPWRTNQFHNRSEYRGWPKAKNPPDYYPNNYPPGITWEIADVADGFPITGFLQTNKHADGYLVQTLTPVDGTFNLLMRTSRSSDGNWSDWRGRKVALTFANGWTNFGGVYRTAGVTIDHANIIHLAGMIKPGTLAANTKIADLPAGFRPTNQQIVNATAADAGGIQVQVLLEFFADGAITLKQYTGTPAYISLTGISFFP